MVSVDILQNMAYVFSPYMVDYRHRKFLFQFQGFILDYLKYVYRAFESWETAADIFLQKKTTSLGSGCCPKKGEV